MVGIHLFFDAAGLQEDFLLCLINLLQFVFVAFDFHDGIPVALFGGGKHGVFGCVDVLRDRFGNFIDVSSSVDMRLVNGLCKANQNVLVLLRIFVCGDEAGREDRLVQVIRIAAQADVIVSHCLLQSHRIRAPSCAGIDLIGDHGCGHAVYRHLDQLDIAFL